MERTKREYKIDDVFKKNQVIKTFFKRVAKHSAKHAAKKKKSDILSVIDHTPNEQQHIVLNGIHAFYEKYDIGKLIWACGLGKAMLGLFIVKTLGFKRVLIGVPSIQLQDQMIEEIKKVFPLSLVQRVGGGSTYDPSITECFVVSSSGWVVYR
jgi:predicted helicase